MKNNNNNNNKNNNNNNEKDNKQDSNFDWESDLFRKVFRQEGTVYIILKYYPYLQYSYIYYIYIYIYNDSIIIVNCEND